MTRLNKVVLFPLLLGLVWGLVAQNPLQATELKLKDLKEIMGWLVTKSPSVEAIAAFYIPPINQSLNGAIDNWFEVEKGTSVQNDSDREDRIQKLSDPEKDRLIEYISKDNGFLAVLGDFAGMIVETLLEEEKKGKVELSPNEKIYLQLMTAPPVRVNTVAAWAKPFAEVRVLGERRRPVSVEGEIQALRDVLAQVQVDLATARQEIDALKKEMRDLQAKLSKNQSNNMMLPWVLVSILAVAVVLLWLR